MDRGTRPQEGERGGIRICRTANSRQIEEEALRGGRRAGRRAGEELFEGNKFDGNGRLGTLDERCRKGAGADWGRNSAVGNLADLAGSVALAGRMDVAGGDDDEENGEQADGERQDAECVPAGTTIGLPRTQCPIPPMQL